MKIYSFSRRPCRSRVFKAKHDLFAPSRASRGLPPLSWLLGLLLCFVLGLLAGLLCAPSGLISSFAASKQQYQQEAMLPPATLDGSSALNTGATEDGSQLLLIEQAQSETAGQAEPGSESAAASGEDAASASSEEDKTAALASGPPLVCIYCTHAGEEYQGQTRVNGQPGGVMSAAAALADELQQRGVAVVFDQTLHDSPSYDGAYGSSLASISAIKEENPQLEVYIDVHRDSAIAGVSTTLEAQGQRYARMMFIIGTNEKLERPLWQQNHAFALSLDEALEELLPGVTRDPRVYSGRYNQHISPEAILVEIGSNDNTQEEAERSARLLAQALCQVKGW